MVTLMGKSRRTEIMLSLSFKNKFGLFLYTYSRVQVASTPASHSGGPEFRSVPGDQLF
jgi:hypothetical protein